MLKYNRSSELGSLPRRSQRRAGRESISVEFQPEYSNVENIFSTPYHVKY